MRADSLAQNTANVPEFICPIKSAQAQKFWISMKKRPHWASVVREQEHCTIEQLTELLSVLL